MKSIEIIDAKNIDRLDVIGYSLAETYKIAFAGEPWNEVSRCDSADCEIQFTDLESGCACLKCGLALTEAYNTEELLLAWRQMIGYDDATLEASINAQGDPTLATIVRPTTPDELFERKYADVASMRTWLRNELPSKFVWIEDTFANRNVSPSGNLKDRGATLGRIATRYSGLLIATRTLTPAIVAATLRDMGSFTTVSVGSQSLDLRSDVLSYAQRLGTVPDRRTFLRIDSRADSR